MITSSALTKKKRKATGSYSFYISLCKPRIFQIFSEIEIAKCHPYPSLGSQKRILKTSGVSSSRKAAQCIDPLSVDHEQGTHTQKSPLNPKGSSAIHLSIREILARRTTESKTEGKK